MKVIKVITTEDNENRNKKTKHLVPIDNIDYFTKVNSAGNVIIHLKSGAKLETTSYWGHIQKKIENAKDISEINSRGDF